MMAIQQSSLCISLPTVPNRPGLKSMKNKLAANPPAASQNRSFTGFCCRHATRISRSMKGRVCTGG
jgi:hypothetical protein